MSRTVGLLGVPSSAGARTPGQEKGPTALRGARLLELLAAEALDVRDHGDLPEFRWRPDSMGVAHLLNEPGSARELAGLGATTPMPEAGKVMFFGQSAVSVRPPEDPRDVEGVAFSKHGFRSYHIEVVTGRASEAASDARAAIESDDGPFIVHFDVDVLDFLDCPQADQPEDRGLPLDEAMECLAVFAGSSRFGGLVVTEINPDHADAEGVTLRRFAEGIVGALAGGSIRG